MAYVTVDAVNPDDSIAGTVAVEENFWNAYSSQLSAWAAYYGFNVNVPGTYSPGANVSSLPEWQSWIKSLGAPISAKAPPATSSSSTAVPIIIGIAGLAFGILLVGLAARD